MENKLSISDKLAKLREGKNLTMKDVADGIGMKADSYRNYERGRLQPSIDTVVKLANFFDVTTDYLLGREPAPNPFADLNLSEEDEKEVIEKYMSLPPKVRAIMLDVLRQLGDAIGNEHQKNLDKSELIEVQVAARSKSGKVRPHTEYITKDQYEAEEALLQEVDEDL